MKVKMILPALTKTISLALRPIPYSIFPPLGLATLAGYLNDNDEIDLQDEHVERLNLDDQPDLVVLQADITSAYHAYDIADHYRARGCHVALGGLHVTSLPAEAAQHADTIFLGPGEDIWPLFLEEFRAGYPRKVYASKLRSLIGLPKMRRNLIKRERYLAPNSIMVSKGCPPHCGLNNKDIACEGYPFYTQRVDDALAEIARLPGRQLYFLDSHLFDNPAFAHALFDGMQGMNRVWQAIGTVQTVLTQPQLLEKAAACGLKSLFIEFETPNRHPLKFPNQPQNLNRDYSEAIQCLRDLGVMVNGSFVFGMDDDDESVFERTVDWAIRQGIETATFHIRTPYPGTALYQRMQSEGRLLHQQWDLYDTRHAVYQPRHLSPEQLETGCRQAYKDFYRWRSIFEGTSIQPTLSGQLRQLGYSAGWKKFEPVWDWMTCAHRASTMLPTLEKILATGSIFPETSKPHTMLRPA